MPSPVEWAAIRDVFLQLYLVDGKTLAQVRLAFEQQGFNATQKQWKTQIAKWDVRKNNRQSDMLFAVNRLLDRKATGKDTTFYIGGRTRKSCDIARYWKRKKVAKLANHNHSPQTPPNIEQHTPPRSAHSTEQICENWVNSIFSPDKNEYVSTQQSLASTSTLSPVPCQTRDLEIILHQGRNFYSFCAVRSPESLHAHDRLTNDQTPLRRFWSNGRKLAACAKFGTAPFCARRAYLTCCELIPVIIDMRELKFLGLLVQLLVYYYRHDSMFYVKDFLHRVCQSSFRNSGFLHPLFQLAQAMLRSRDDMVPLSEALLRASVDYSTDHLGIKHPQTRLTARALSTVFCMTRDWRNLYRLAESEHLYYLAHASTHLKTADITAWLDAQACMADAQLRLDNINAAAQIVEQAFSFCNRWISDDYELSKALCTLFTILGDIKLQYNVKGAVDAYEQAVRVASGVLSPDDYTLMHAVNRLEKALHFSNGSNTTV